MCVGMHSTSVRKVCILLFIWNVSAAWCMLFRYTESLPQHSTALFQFTRHEKRRGARSVWGWPVGELEKTCTFSLLYAQQRHIFAHTTHHEKSSHAHRRANTIRVSSSTSTHTNKSNGVGVGGGYNKRRSAGFARCRLHRSATSIQIC